MVASIDTLKANINNGFALADRFEVQLPPLNSLVTNPSSILDVLTGAEPLRIDLGSVAYNIGQKVLGPDGMSLVDTALQYAGIDMNAAIPIFDAAKKLGLSLGPRFDVDPTRRVSMMCTGVNMPGRQITTVDRTIGMVTQAMPYAFVEDEVQMTFRLDQDYSAFSYFYIWQNSIIGNADTNFSVAYKSEYARDITISQLAKSAEREFLRDNEIYKVKLLQAFPKSISSIALADANQNTIVELTVDIAYTRWETAN
jgi:hypothetical protein